MPSGGDRVALAEWLRVPGLRWPDILRGDEPRAVPMQQVPPPKLADRRPDLRLDARKPSPIADTIFASPHLPLRLWFRAMYHLTQSKQGISSIELGRRLGVTQTTAWKIKHKLAQVMLERDATKQLGGRIEIDDAYFGGERSGGKRGRGAPGKTPFVAAVETTPEGKPVRLKLRRVASFCSHALSTFAKRSLDPACEVVSDGLA